MADVEFFVEFDVRIRQGGFGAAGMDKAKDQYNNLVFNKSSRFIMHGTAF